ncbi:MAG: hypothetical protein AAB552_03880 [Patescibacteria group bacterium]
MAKVNRVRFPFVETFLCFAVVALLYWPEAVMKANSVTGADECAYVEFLEKELSGCPTGSWTWVQYFLPKSDERFIGP